MLIRESIPCRLVAILVLFGFPVVLMLGACGCKGEVEETSKTVIETTEEFDMSKVPAAQKSAATALQQAGAELEQNPKGEIVIVQLGEKANDDTLHHLKSLTTLLELSLTDAKVTDKAVAVLKELKNLKVLDLEDSGLSSAAIDELVKALPNCEIRGGGEDDE